MLYKQANTTPLPYHPNATARLCARSGAICLREPGRDRVFIHPHAEQAFEHNALSAIREWILTHQGSSVAVFYLSYDAALEDLNLLPKASDIQLPKASVHLYDGHLDIDHHAQTITSYALTKSMTQQHQEALITPSPELQPYTYTGDQTANFSFESYAQAFNEVMQGLSQGDFYQINLAQRFRIPIQGSYFSLFEAITKQAPSAFACYWPLDARSSIVCNSPESFIRIDQGRMITEPIKGTMKRHTDPLIDAQWAQALADSEKDQAENLMIVDLMRNDVGKLAIPGSVKVDKLFDIMTLSYAHHMVSQVSAQLPPHVHPLDALLACFPGGSITGAPKRAAMQAIHRLEPHPRHLYCGTIGYLTAEGTLRSNIAIRTAIVQDDMMTFWAGGGLVLDSELRSEYEECMTKTRFALT